ncbi:MAG: hypothetical protein IT361_01670 [Gemmatimonadaceae bacterium]|nr:hypothetical protein [Gemmatimonadaceae bacterium]
MASWLCTHCGTDAPNPPRQGSNWIALALACAFVVPGVVYLAWRYTQGRRACPICGHAEMIPTDAPLARTWRAAGWLPGQHAPTGATDPRMERIEQAIDAIAVEVERVGRLQSQPRLRDDRPLP